MPQPWEATLPLEVWQASLVVALVIDVVVVLVADAALKSALGDYTKWRVLSRGFESVRKARRRAKVVRGASLFALSALTVAASLFLDGTAVDRVENRCVAVQSLRYNELKNLSDLTSYGGYAHENNIDIINIDGNVKLDINVSERRVSERVVDASREHTGKLLYNLKDCTMYPGKCTSVDHTVPKKNFKLVSSERISKSSRDLVLDAYTFNTSSTKGFIFCSNEYETEKQVSQALCFALADNSDGSFRPHLVSGYSAEDDFVHLLGQRTFFIDGGLWWDTLRAEGYSKELRMSMQRIPDKSTPIVEGINMQEVLAQSLRVLDPDVTHEIRSVKVTRIVAKTGFWLVLLDGLVLGITVLLLIVAAVLHAKCRKIKVSIKSTKANKVDKSSNCEILLRPGEPALYITFVGIEDNHWMKLEKQMSFLQNIGIEAEEKESDDAANGS